MADAPKVFGVALAKSRTGHYWSGTLAGFQVLISSGGLGTLETEDGEMLFQVDECNCLAAAGAIEREFRALRDKLTKAIGDA